MTHCRKMVVSNCTTYNIPITTSIRNANLLICYLAASTKAVLITFNGSIIPALIISTYSPEQEESWRISSNKNNMYHYINGTPKVTNSNYRILNTVIKGKHNYLFWSDIFWIYLPLTTQLFAKIIFKNIQQYRNQNLNKFVWHYETTTSKLNSKNVIIN